MTNHERENVWIERLAAYKLSGLNKKTWCEINKIKTKSFYRWCRKLNGKNKGQEQKMQRFVMVKEKSEGENSVNLIGVTIGKATINISKGFDTETLEMILKVVGKVC